MLVTSRNEVDLANLYLGASGTNLGVLSVDEATNFTKKIFQTVPHESTPEQDAKLARWETCASYGPGPRRILKLYNDEK